MKRILFIMLAMVLALGLTVPVVQASDPRYTEEWDGRGTGSQDCSLVGPPERPATGWIHWVFSTKGDSTSAELVLGGTGSGTYYPGEPLVAEVWHFYTPYFNITGLNATIYLYGGDPGPGGGLVISDYCPGGGPGPVRELTVWKTVNTTYTRTHNWSIVKAVGTENGYTENGYPKVWLYVDGSGDETATWTINVTYEGYEDSDFNVSGQVTIENTGDSDEEITDVEDLLAGEEIEVNFGVDFPYTLAVGEVLVGNYSVDVASNISGYNRVTVTTAVGGPYEADPVEIVWGDPTTEVNNTVTVVDTSDLFGEVTLGTLDADDYEPGAVIPFTYDEDFAWEDYGADDCREYTYENTAEVIGDGEEVLDSADATLKVNVQCYIYETAYAKGSSAICFIPTFKNWGWTNNITPGNYTMDLWAAAGRCDTSKGIKVGTVTVVYNGGGYVTVIYNVAAPHSLEETHVYAGTTKFPQVKQGKKTVSTVAPGRYYNASPFGGGTVYVIAHAVVGIPDPSFGP